MRKPELRGLQGPGGGASIRGKMLYDDIKKDGTTSGWSNDDYKCFDN